MLAYLSQRLRCTVLRVLVFFTLIFTNGACSSMSKSRCSDMCNGEWGPHGRSGSVGCLCRTKDVGVECHDSNDCEAACNFHHWEIVRTDEDGTQWGMPIGRCAEFETTYGCGWQIHKEDTKSGPLRVTNDLPQQPYICTD
jgi:hypothetical protein